jgi:hypothetical protein
MIVSTFYSLFIWSSFSCYSYEVGY